MSMHTVRIYFEHGTKIKNLSRWKRLFGGSLVNELLKEAKNNGIKHVIVFHISKGYLHHQAIQWGVDEIPDFRHPQCIELTGEKKMIDKFLHEQHSLLEVTETIIVDKQEVSIWNKGGIIHK